MKRLFSSLIVAVVAFFATTVTLNAASAPAPLPVPAAAADDDDEDEPPYVEPAFTVTFNIDNADAVYLTVNDKPISHTAGDNVITVDPGDGYIKVFVNEGYAFVTFDDVTRDNASYLQYDRQTTPVTVRKMLSTSIDIDETGKEGIVVDGHEFVIRTLDLSTLAQFTMNVNVDDASKVLLRLGTGGSIESGSNRTIYLSDGDNVITYNETDTYLHVQGISWMEPIYSVTFNGKNLVNDGAFNPQFSLRLQGAKTADGELVITALKPEEPTPYTFTVTVDDPECIRYFTRMPANKDLVIAAGDNPVAFGEDNYFEVWCTQQAELCQLDGDDIEFNTANGRNMYTVTPKDGSHLVLKFHPDGPALPTFTLTIDDASKVESFINFESGQAYQLVDGDNEIDIEYEGDRFRLLFVDKASAYSFTCDGKDVAKTSRGYYDFFPKEGSEVVVFFSEPVVPEDPVLHYTINIDNPDYVVVYTGNNPTVDTTIQLVAGENALTIDDNASARINIDPRIGYRITSMTDDSDHVFNPSKEGNYEVKITEGLVINIVTEAVQFNEQFNMIIDNPESVGEYLVQSVAGRELQLSDWFNELMFNNDYDDKIVFGFDPAPAAVYLNGSLMTPSEEYDGLYCFFPGDGDIVRVYMDEVPEIHSVSFDVTDNAAGKFVVYRDLLQDFVPESNLGLEELHGTYYVIFPTDENVRLKVLVTELAKSRSEDAEPVEIEMEDGAFLFPVNADMKVEILNADMDAIETVLATPADGMEVYNLQGIRVSSAANTADLRNLPAGLYIVNGKKVIVK